MYECPHKIWSKWFWVINIEWLYYLRQLYYNPLEHYSFILGIFPKQLFLFSTTREILVVLHFALRNEKILLKIIQNNPGSSGVVVAYIISFVVRMFIQGWAVVFTYFELLNVDPQAGTPTASATSEKQIFREGGDKIIFTANMKYGIL